MSGCREASVQMHYQIMYSSQAVTPMTVADLEAILEDARAGNKAREITGALVYVDGVFFQIFEGDKDVVRKLMANIATDSRHRSVTVIYEAEVAARAFDSWSMAYLNATAEQMSRWAGLPGTVTVAELLTVIHRAPDRVPRILVNVLDALAT
jgi:hypothetical protein